MLVSVLVTVMTKLYQMVEMSLAISYLLLCYLYVDIIICTYNHIVSYLIIYIRTYFLMPAAITISIDAKSSMSGYIIVA